MDFNAIWPLLRKEKWTWKAGTGIQKQYVHLLVLARIRANEVVLLSIASQNYVKPERKVRVVGPSDDIIPPGHYRGQSKLGKAPAKKSVMPVVPAKRHADASSKKPAKKKKTKKQLAEEASARRRKMATFDKKMLTRTPQSRLMLTRTVLKTRAIRTRTPPVETSADAEGNEDAANTDTDPISNGTTEETRNAVVTISDKTESHSKEDDSVEGIDDGADEVYSPANNKESDDEDDVYTDEQLDQMKIEDWNVLPDNVEAEIVDDPDVDTMYAGYGGPSQDIIAASKSPLKLFYYFLPKSFWRQVATQTNIYWKQTLESRLQQAEEKKPRSQSAHHLVELRY
ncbi:hypothetical protein PInf_022011 [Phytophthora infestans]|nr:hypothetical protein PInf_022011 [Phytophthora infestans]